MINDLLTHGVTVIIIVHPVNGIHDDYYVLLGCCFHQ